MSPALDAWFVGEILVHEAALTRYLLRSWPQRDDVHDLIGEGVDCALQVGEVRDPAVVSSYLGAEAL